MEYASEGQAGLGNDARAGNAVAGMSETARAELHRSLADYSKKGVGARDDRTDTRRDRRGAPTRNPGDADYARVAADLHRTERRIETRVPTAATSRELRLSSRAGRLQRKLRRLA